MKKWKSWNCHDCGVKEGQLHKLGCDMEQCPKCDGQLISCGCFPNFENLPFRIPYILIPVKCGLCGDQWSRNFHVPDEDWKKYVIPSLQDKSLCKDCYKELKNMFPKGWKQVEESKQIE